MRASSGLGRSVSNAIKPSTWRMEAWVCSQRDSMTKKVCIGPRTRQISIIPAISAPALIAPDRTDRTPMTTAANPDRATSA
jgi:hypothetical protein